MAGYFKIHDIEETTGLVPFDIYFSRFITELDDKGGPEVQLAAFLLSRVMRSGDSCLDLVTAASKPVGDEAGGARTPPLRKWVSQLRASNAVGRPGQLKPLILDSSHRLYLYRYWQYEKRLADAILDHAHKPLSDILSPDFKSALDRYFPAAADNTFDWQKAAAVIALSNSFSIITGGPGTGKTFTIARILALYCALNQTRTPRIHLSAPTGKAAAQLRSSVISAKTRLDPGDSAQTWIPDEVFTLHRLLKAKPGRSEFYYNSENHLPTDILVVDEASMVDLALMSKLVSALPSGARIILAGDRDQLASVEAGSVFGDMCGILDEPKYSNRMGELYQHLTGEPMPAVMWDNDDSCRPVGDAIAVLHYNYRFASGSGLGALSQTVRTGKAKDAFELLVDPDELDLNWVDYQKEVDIHQQLVAAILEGFEPYLKSDTAQSSLKAMQHFQILTALRKGPYGADGINGLAESVLAGNGLIHPDHSGGGIHYHRRPVMINRNDYDMQLFNGDLCVLWKDGENRSDEINAYFADSDDSIRKIWPHRLPVHETVFAMTVHKSQGSEFDHVLLVLPPQDSELLTRELIYTALTRARQKVTVWAPRAVLEKALNRRLERRSGLRDALWSVAKKGGG